MEEPFTLGQNIDFIRSETAKIDSAAEVKERVLKACDYFSDLIAQYKEGEDPRAFFAKGFAIFNDDIIPKLENDPKEETMYMLLITHVADMTVLVHSFDIK
jgi:hypothetical protein